MEISSSLLQIVSALIIIFIIYILTIYILNVSSIIKENQSIVKPKQTTLIVNGFSPVSYLSKKSWNTSNYMTNNFVSIPKSVNTQGGTQFTYQFWIKIDDADPKFFQDLTVFVKGETQKYKLGLYDVNSLNQVKTIPGSSSSGIYAIACPLIKFIDSYKNIQIVFNTLKNPLTIININMNATDNVLTRRNMLSLLPINWYMLTFTFSDNFSNYINSEDGINFKFWINDVLYQENTTNDTPLLKGNTLLQNNGDITFFPEINNSSDFMKIGNFTYYSWALNQKDVSKAYSKGPPKKSFIENDTVVRKPPILSAYNKIDLYNY